MSQFIKFYFTSSMFNMFRTLTHASSGACDFSIVSPHWLCVLTFDVCWSFGVAGLGWYPCSRQKHSFSLLHMFRTLIHPSSGACDFSIVSPHWLCVLSFDVCWSFGVAGLGWYPCSRLKLCFSLLHGYHPKPATPKLQHTSKLRTHNQCGDTIEKSQAPDDGCINVRNMLSIEEVK